MGIFKLTHIQTGPPGASLMIKLLLLRMSGEVHAQTCNRLSSVSTSTNLPEDQGLASDRESKDQACLHWGPWKGSMSQRP